MFRLSPHTRAGLATIVALAQVLVVTHTTLVAHTLSASGAIVEQATKSEAAHDHDSTSWCREETHRHLAADALCQVTKTAQTPRVASKGLGLEARSAVVSPNAELLRSAYSPLSVLVVSPKASPPRLA